MKWVKATYARFKYVVWAIGGVVVVIFAALLKNIVVPPRKPGKKIALPEIPPVVQAKVDKAHEEALVARVEARVEAEAEVVKLEEVAKIDDGAERRKRLAAMLEDI